MSKRSIGDTGNRPQQVMELPLGRFVFRQGDLGSEMYVIHEGRIEILKEMIRTGEEREALLDPTEIAEFKKQAENALEARKRLGAIESIHSRTRTPENQSLFSPAEPLAQLHPPGSVRCRNRPSDWYRNQKQRCQRQL